MSSFVGEPGCEGVAATWCPRCGDCTCPRYDDGGWESDLTDPDCPLHGINSDHVSARLEDTDD